MAQARAPPLNGKPVPLPELSERAIGWRHMQIISNKRDNPYQQKEAPRAAEFLSHAPDAGSVTKTELDIAKYASSRKEYEGHADKSFAWQFDNVFTESECASLIDMFNEKKLTPALTNNNWMYADGDPRKGDELEWDRKRRDTHIAMFDCPEISSWVWQKLEPFMKEVQLPPGWQLDHINSYIRGICYCLPGQFHTEHYDLHLSYPQGKYAKEHPYSRAKSFLTLIMYLNEVPEECGGATAFCLPPEGSVEESDLRCQPKAGRVLIHTQNLRHTSVPMKENGVKWIIRSDIMALPSEAAVSERNLEVEK